MTPSLSRYHANWPRLLDTSGTFLTLPVLKRAFPDGLSPVQREQVAGLREQLDLWHAAQERPAPAAAAPELQTQQRAFIRWVLTDLLSYGQVLREGQAIPVGLTHVVPAHDTLAPDFVVVEPRQETPTPRVLVMVWPPGTELMGRPGDRWSATPTDRMALLLRATGVRTGLVTDGSRWALVSTAAPATAVAVWDAEIWLEERVTLDAFSTLLGAHRLFAVPAADTLEALFIESAGAQEEVTGQLGRQVREAVQLLVAAFSRVDRESEGRLLAHVSDADVYAAAVTVLMRLVFMLYAEELRLFPVDDELFATSYSASRLLEQLDQTAHGELEVLDRRFGAWRRLLALFRIVVAGVQHEDLRLPAYGGSLFDPDRYPFLEGRPFATTPLSEAEPIRITDLEIREVLRALQFLQFTSGGVREARRLSYRNLDVEQIGHVYEGLLDHAAVRVEAPHLGLAGRLEPELALDELEQRRMRDESAFRAWLVERTGMTERRIAALLASAGDDLALRHLRVACDGDDELVDRIAPYLALLRVDPRGLPVVFLPGSTYVTQSSGRRSSGTYYTPKSLAEEMVEHALEPLVYAPGPQDTDDRARWRLRTATQILDLRVCDMTMGSGAFLVAATRFLADRLLETSAAGGDGHTPAPDAEAAVVDARRLVAELCIYGVERNPMAIEMAKLSMWLVTLAKDRPFTFLDAQLRPGDALLGLTLLDQLEDFHLDPERGRKIHAGHLFVSDIAGLGPLLEQARELRDRLSSIHVIELRDAQDKARLFTEHHRLIAEATVVADLVVAAGISTAEHGASALDHRLVAASAAVHEALSLDHPARRAEAFHALAGQAAGWLEAGRPEDAPPRAPLHWCLEFPEVFDRPRTGFDAVVGNPPFQGGQKITGALGLDYRAHLVQTIGSGVRGSADLVAYMLLRAAQISGGMALLATNTIAQGDTRQVGLDGLIAAGWTVHRATKSRKWPGDANLEISQIWLRREWAAPCVLVTTGADGTAVECRVDAISSSLEMGSETGDPARLMSNARLSFQGSIVLGMGFVLEPDEAAALIERDPRNRDVVFPYLNGEDLNSRPDGRPSRWVINFFDWPQEKAQQYGDCWAIVEQRVRPERERLRPDGTFAARGARATRYWQHAERALSLYRAIADLDRVIVIAQVSSLVQPVMVPTGQVFAHKLVVFAYDDQAHLALLCSSFHTWWAQRYSSTLRNDVSYAPSDCFVTFALPRLDEVAESAGRSVHETRQALMLDRNLGLTKTYNLVHNPAVGDADIAALRAAHIDVDVAVRHCYGWDDLHLDHGFHDTPLGRRFAVSPTARTELLHRLLALNHERAAREAAAAPARPAATRTGRQSGGRNGRAVTPAARRGVEGTLPLIVEGTLPL